MLRRLDESDGAARAAHLAVRAAGPDTDRLAALRSWSDRTEA